MSLEETKQLLQTHKISPNKLLGQNFMIEPSLYPKLCTYATLTNSDTVLDAGAGFGFLTLFLVDKCKAVIAVEKDPRIARVLHEQTKKIRNLTILEGDVLKVALPHFNKVIAIPPYYLSSHLTTWLLERQIDCSVLILQKEFANRLIASVGSEEYSWLTVIIAYHALVELLDPVPKTVFYPQPEVDSVILRITPYPVKPFEVKNYTFFIRLIKWLFTQRNKKVTNALSPFIKNYFKLTKQETGNLSISHQFKEKRVRELAPKDFGDLANALSN